jgi:hypothetical protein
MKLLALFSLQGLYQKTDKSYFFPGEKYWKHLIFGAVYWEKVSPSAQVYSFC